MAVIENEMRAFADEMLAERTITQKKYKEIIGELEAEKQVEAQGSYRDPNDHEPNDLNALNGG